MVKKYEEEIEKLKKDVSLEYEKHQLVARILSTEQIIFSNSGAGFSKIGIHPLIENKWFLQEDYANRFEMLSSDIPNAEVRHIVNKIFDKIKQKIDAKDVDFLKFKKVIYDFGKENSVLLVETTNFYNLFRKFEKELEMKYDYSLNGFTIMGIPVVKCRSDDLSNNILLLKKDFGKWYYKKPDNPYSEKLFIKPNRRSTDTSIEIYVVIKLGKINKDKIKIISFDKKDLT